MNAPDNALLIYLDQNILSHLRKGKNARVELVELLRKLEEKNVIFVYSMTHVEECRDSSQPEKFVQVIEELPVYLMEFENASDQQITLSLDKARGLLLEPEDVTHRAKRLIENLLMVMRFASGGLGETKAQELKDYIAEKMADFWETVQQDIETDVLGAEFAKQALSVARDEMATTIESFPFEQIRDEWGKGWAKLRERLPANYAQLDEVPDEDAVSFVFSCLDRQGGAEMEKQFPQGFWSEREGRETDALAGLAFKLFMCGLVRDKRVKKGSTERQAQHFLGQFRDGVHIENAAQCEMFITFDKGAARLARALYAYAGVKTRVVKLQIKDTAA